MFARRIGGVAATRAYRESAVARPDKSSGGAGVARSRRHATADVLTAEDAIQLATQIFERSDAIRRSYPGKERVDAVSLLGFALGRPPAPDDLLSPLVVDRFRSIVERHAAGEPTEYITGRATFCGLTLATGPGAFIPRDSSERLASLAVRMLAGWRSPTLIDLGTGVGAVALAAAAAVPSALIYGVDIEEEPLALARANARTLRLRNVRFIRGDLFRPLPSDLAGRVDIITGYLPYVPKDVVGSLVPEIRDHEPAASVSDSSPDGLTIIRRAAAEAYSWLRPGGFLVLEASSFCSRSFVSAFRRAGLERVRSIGGKHDLSRVVVGCRPIRYAERR